MPIHSASSLILSSLPPSLPPSGGDDQHHSPPRLVQRQEGHPAFRRVSPSLPPSLLPSFPPFLSFLPPSLTFPIPLSNTQPSFGQADRGGPLPTLPPSLPPSFYPSIYQTHSPLLARRIEADHFRRHLYNEEVYVPGRCEGGREGGREGGSS